jgi:hypothetical protein
LSEWHLAGQLTKLAMERVVDRCAHAHDLGRTKAHELERLLSWTWKAEQLAAAANA